MKENRDKRFCVRLTAGENRRVEEKMREVGITTQAVYARKMLLDGYCISLQFEELKKINSLLGRCSSNLNQYARRANSIGDFYRKDMENLQKDFEEIRKLQMVIVEKLSALK